MNHKSDLKADLKKHFRRAEPEPEHQAVTRPAVVKEREDRMGETVKVEEDVYVVGHGLTADDLATHERISWYGPFRDRGQAASFARAIGTDDSAGGPIFKVSRPTRVTGHPRNRPNDETAPNSPSAA